MRIPLSAHKFFVMREQAIAAYAAAHWGVHPCLFCGRAVHRTVWHVECAPDV